MSFSEKYFLNIFYFIILWVVAELLKPSAAASNPDILSDYFFGSAELRTRSVTLPCEDDIFKLFCQNICGGAYKCEKTKCECIDNEHTHKKKMISRTLDDPEPYYYPFEDNKYLIHSNEFAEDVSYQSTGVLRNAEEKEIKPIDEVSERPALRHHIAHFCPNLEVARQCIRKCMQLGKPAFCGKDHVCYCGYRSDHGEDNSIEPEDVFSQYKDLYEKYFGKLENSEVL